jgi:hypothetical protein
MKTLKVKIKFEEELLGTASSNPDIYTDFIGSKASDAKSLEEEVAAVGAAEVIEKSMTIFPRNDAGKPILFDYQIRGFFKDSAGFLKKANIGKTAKLTAHKKAVDGLIFVKPRKIELMLPDGASVTNCQRPLRGQTAQGERIALANSEAVPAGTTCEFEVICLKDEHIDLVKEWLDYGQWHGIGQWRNSGKGKFSWEDLGESDG